MDMPNLAITSAKEGAQERRSILMWDPRPGMWKIRLSGSGKFTTSVTTQGELHVCCIQFFGRAGVFSMDRFQPVRGARHQSQVLRVGFQHRSIEFRLIDERGESIAPIKFRQSDYSSPNNFTLFLETPDRPFRVSARGLDTSGKSFQRVIGWLIRPQTSDPSSAVAGPPTEGAPAEEDRAQTWAPQEWNQSAIEGEYKVIRAQIVARPTSLSSRKRGIRSASVSKLRQLSRRRLLFAIPVSLFRTSQSRIHWRPGHARTKRLNGAGAGRRAEIKTVDIRWQRDFQVRRRL